MPSKWQRICYEYISNWSQGYGWHSLGEQFKEYTRQ